MFLTSTKKQLAIAYLNTLTFSCVQMVLYTTIPYISEQTSVGTPTIIAAISIGSLLFAFFSPYWAAKSDELGRKRVLSFGMIGMGISFGLLALLFIFNSSLSLQAKVIMIYASRIIYGLLCSSIVPVSQAWQLDLIPEAERIKVMTMNSMCLNLGRILGPVVILVKQVNFEYMIYFFTVWIFSLALGCFLTSSPIVQSNTLKIKTSFKEILKTQVKSWKESIKESIYPILLALIFTTFVGILHSFLGHHLKITLEIRGDEATVLMAKLVLYLSALALITQQLSIWFLKSAWKSRVVFGAISLVIGSFILTYAKTVSGIWLSVTFIAFASALIPPAYLALVSKTDKEENAKGKKVGLASIAHSLGYAIGAGLIALSMKLNILSETGVIMLVSLSIFLIVVLLIMEYSERMGEKTL